MPRSTRPSERLPPFWAKLSRGLNQDFNSLDAQRDAGAALLRTQADEGWTVLPEQYYDGGFTGANIDRPALRRLLADVQAKKVDCIVVYKVDRLSRSIGDFGKIMEVLEKHGATFVSVTLWERSAARAVHAGPSKSKTGGSLCDARRSQFQV